MKKDTIYLNLRLGIQIEFCSLKTAIIRYHPVPNTSDNTVRYRLVHTMAFGWCCKYHTYMHMCDVYVRCLRDSDILIYSMCSYIYKYNNMFNVLRTYILNFISGVAIVFHIWFIWANIYLWYKRVASARCCRSVS